MNKSGKSKARSVLAAALFQSLLIHRAIAQPASCDVDVCFAIDESSFLSQSQYDKELQMVKAVGQKLSELSTTTVTPRMSVWKYGQDCSDNDYLLDPTADTGVLGNKMDHPDFPRDGGSQNMYAGLECCKRTLTAKKRKRVVVLLTGGSPNTGPGAPDNFESKVVSLSDSMESSHVNVITVGVHTGDTSELDMSFLANVATDSTYAHSVSLDSVQSALPGLSSQICEPLLGVSASAFNTPPPTPLPTPVPTPPTEKWPVGKCEVDICFAIDESGSLGQDKFDAELDFVARMAESVEKRAWDPEVGVTPYSPTFAGYLFDDNSNDADVVTQRTSDASGFRQKVDGAKGRYNGGATNMYAGMQRCKESLEAQPYKTRALVLLTDGQPNRGVGFPSLAKIKSNLVRLGETLASHNVNVFTIGLHPANDPSVIDHELMEKMSSDPSYFSTVTFEDLQSATVRNQMADSMVGSLCKPKISVNRVDALGNTTDYPSQIGVNTVCKCRERPATSNPNGCLNPVGSGLCVARDCVEAPTYVCDLSGNLVCDTIGIGIEKYRCTSALNSTHCPCDTHPTYTVRPAAAGTTPV
eukprot:CAMPEP_0198320742 /NCGR_PEP_ID=MMETSP1450-20131203/9607_1 /TAXON_ID=753684 ORGANISM="Madagascaria erythrocladiodes, Strain CCMP3234" /NCGR_SAMPLE_ID=MMETSP1450 /ASSEMBLY_ACC=CAM_ASM_001115 /LENGTH=582 /DNA_ID=CAMNT_0044024235 /DNA_START=94 /DNA_END=1839 /DNA_ORIENTATION=-